MKRLLIFAIVVGVTITATLVLFKDGTAPQIVTAENRANLVLIDKSQHRLTLLRNDEVLARYPIRRAVEPARAECATAGVYKVEQRNPKRLYRLSLGLGRENGEPRRQALIHGRPRVPETALALVSARFRGCIGVTNKQMREIWRRVTIGTEVVIR